MLVRWCRARPKPTAAKSENWLLAAAGDIGEGLVGGMSGFANAFD